MAATQGKAAENEETIFSRLSLGVEAIRAADRALLV